MKRAKQRQWRDPAPWLKYFKPIRYITMDDLLAAKRYLDGFVIREVVG